MPEESSRHQWYEDSLYAWTASQPKSHSCLSFDRLLFNMRRPARSATEARGFPLLPSEIFAHSPCK